MNHAGTEAWAMLNVLKSIILLYAVGASSSGGLFGASSAGAD